MGVEGVGVWNFKRRRLGGSSKISHGGKRGRAMRNGGRAFQERVQETSTKVRLGGPVGFSKGKE